MINIQIRRYKVDGTYSRTVNVTKLGHRVKETLNAWLVEHTEGELSRHLQTTPCNIMIRRNGKLISYKEFYNV